MPVQRLTCLLLALATAIFSHNVVDADTAAPRTLWDGTGTGGVRVPGAETVPQRGAATASGSYFYQTDLLHPEDTASRIAYGGAVMYAPLAGIAPYGLELGGRLSGMSTYNDRGNPERLNVFGDMLLAAKGTYQLREGLHTGLRAELRLPAGVNGSSGYGDTASYAAQWVSTWRPGQLAVHALAGFLYDRTINFSRNTPTDIERFAWGQRDFNQALYGLSVNYELDRFDSILEISGELPLGEASPAFSDSPLRLTPGLRFRATEDVEVHLAANIALMGTRAPGMAAEPAVDVLAGVRWIFGAAAPGPAAQPRPQPLVQVLVLDEPELAPPAAGSATKDTADLGPGVLTGRITHAVSGDPIAGASVKILPDGPVAKASPQGQYFLTGLIGGTFELRVEAQSMAPSVVTGDAQRGQLTTLDITLRPQATEGRIELRVVDAESKPLSGAQVLIDGQSAGQSDAAGRLQLDKVVPGSREIMVLRKGHRSATAVVEVIAGATARETVMLAAEIKPGYLEVKVMNDAREPIAATVTVEGHPELTRIVDPSAGSVALYRLAPGTYRLRVEAPGFQPEAQQVQIEEDAEEALRFRLQP
jgi:hypothetical protein